MKKLKMVVTSMIVAIAMFTSCKSEVSGGGEETKFSLSKFAKTDFVTVVPQGKVEQIFMEDDSSWNTYYSGTDQFYKGAFLKDRKVQLSAFAMGAYEVTQELYEKVMGTNPSYCVSGSSNYGLMIEGEIQKYRPVENVSWYDAIVFCNKLSLLCGLNPCYKINNTTDTTQWGDVPTSSDATWNAVVCDITANGYRLPTEAEWEFAVRGGDPTSDEWKKAYAGVQTEKESFTSDGYDASLNEYAWYRYNLSGVDNQTISTGNAGYGTHEVGKKKPNGLGLYDMSGNVWEWCYDWYNSDVTSSDTEYKNESGIVENPRGSSAAASFRVRRGGGWYSYAYDCSVSRRNGYSPYDRNYYMGFRLARSL